MTFDLMNARQFLLRHRYFNIAAKIRQEKRAAMFPKDHRMHSFKLPLAQANVYVRHLRRRAHEVIIFSLVLKIKHSIQGIKIYKLFLLCYNNILL